MVMYGYVGLCRAVYGYVWRYMAMWCYLEQFRAMQYSATNRHTLY